MIGTNILHYRILKKLGAGGMGIVYEALDTKLERSVALKFLSDGLTHNPQAMQRFEREAKAVSRLDHPNIGAVFALEHSHDQTFLAMAMYQGTTLAERLEQGPPTIPEALRIVLEIARGMEHAHGQGVIHRDIKPANIYIAKMPNNTELIKILDFGLARLEDSSHQLTRPGATTGTLLYMSPEQLGGKTNAQSDIWAWGAVSYETLTGKTPFNVEGIGALLNAILNAEPTPLEQHRTDIPDILGQTIMQALRKDPTTRPTSMSQIVQNLETLLSSSAERHFSSSQNANVTVPAPPQNPESVFFNNPSSWDTASSVIDTTKPKPRRYPWILSIPIVFGIVIGAWLLLPRSPALENCQPLNNTGAMLDTAIKWSVPLIPLENCGTYGYGQGSAISEYTGATQVQRQVLALLPGTVLVADNVTYPTAQIMQTKRSLQGTATKNTEYQGSGTQYAIGKGKYFTALYPSNLETNVTEQAVTLASTEITQKILTLNVFQVDETDTEIQRLDVTTSDQHSQNFVGALLSGKTAIFLGIGTNATAANFNVNVPLGITQYIITGLEPGSSYKMQFEPDRGWNYISLTKGNEATVNSAGVLVLGQGMVKLQR